MVFCFAVDKCNPVALTYINMINKKEILDNFKENGFRLTNIRKAILDLFYKSKKTLSCQDIQRYLKQKKISANKTTVYRELEFMKNRKVIEEFKLDDGVRRYEVCSNHHHHTVCLKCRKIKCVKLDKELSEQEKKIEKSNKFKIISHSLEFYGLCHKCQAVK
ncbi:MAG: Fur family transcriptional regulator [Candidatus Staskawiczbacteria bacterium]|nr:Fur family transcriptional regulator [Candidatus Staskawiczbacteria bacterium]